MTHETIGRIILTLVKDEFPANKDGLYREDILLGLHWATLLFSRAMRQAELNNGIDRNDLEIDLIITYLIEKYEEDMSTGSVVLDV